MATENELSQSMMSDIVIGIDLGTTNSCVGAYLNDKVKILENKEGGRTTPSHLFFTEQGAVIVGEYAKRMSDAKPEYGIYEIKRLVGRKFDDVKKNISYLPFQVKNISNEPAIVIQNKNQIVKKRPQDLCTYILEKLKADAEAKFGHKIDKAVITVPAYFNIAQREVTLAAARQAGFTVLKLLNEPTAAALSYYYESKCKVDEASYSLVYDLGGGTFDVAILRRHGADINIVGVDGETHLGGHDFDNLLVEYACQVLNDKYGYNPKNDRRNMRRLNNECEAAKKILSVCEETTIILNAFLATPNTIEIPITRGEFEKTAASFFAQTIEIVDRCLKKAHLAKTDIKEVIMAGGSTRIPKIQTMISDYFDGKTLTKFVNPDECVAEGAALQAAMLSKAPEQQINQIKVTDVTSLSLGISNFVDLMTFLIPRNTPIPTISTTKRITVYQNQTNMTFDIYEGERLDAKKNHFLGVLEIGDLTPAPPGQCSVTVAMSIDQNGILTVLATETVSSRTKNLKIVYTRGTRNDNEVKTAVTDARENEVEDERFKKFANLKGHLIKYCVRAKYNFEEKGLNLTHREEYEKCSELLNTLKNFGVDDEQDVLRITNETRVWLEPIVAQNNFVNMP